MEVDNDVEAQSLVDEIDDLELGLFDWQVEALQTWAAKNCRGVVEAVTGTGKTRVGIAAAQLAITQGFEVLVVVPTRELMYQWHRQLQTHLEVEVGLAGDGNVDWFHEYDVVVSTIHTAKNNRKLAARYKRLLIADECHRYASEGWSLALTDDYEWRLGLTATFARPDGLHEGILTPYFGGIVFNLWYDRALEDGLIAEFDIAFVAVRLSPSEEQEYYRVEEKRESIYRNLRRYLDYDPSPQQLMEQVNAWADSPGFEPHQRVARGYRTVLQERRRILAESETKIDALRKLGGPVLDAQGTLVFTDTQESAKRAALALGDVGSRALAVYSDLQKYEREQAIQAFREQNVTALVAPRILDEGIDVPEADLGILISMNRSRRQLVQRLGRVLRRKPDGRHARLLVFCAMGTQEDPRWVGPSKLDHIEEILQFARRLRYFELEHDEDALHRFLAGLDGGMIVDLTSDEIVREVDNEPTLENLPTDVAKRDVNLVDKAVGDFQMLDELLKRAIRCGLLKAGDRLVCNRENIRDFGAITLTDTGRLHLERTGLTVNLNGASKFVVGFTLQFRALLESWQTSDGLLLSEIWELIQEMSQDDGAQKVIAPRREIEEQEALAPKASENTPTESLVRLEGSASSSDSMRLPELSIGAEETTFELRPDGVLTELVVRNGIGNEVIIRLHPKDAGALGAQLLSASFRPLQAPYLLSSADTTDEYVE